MKTVVLFFLCIASRAVAQGYVSPEPPPVCVLAGETVIKKFKGPDENPEIVSKHYEPPVDVPYRTIFAHYTIEVNGKQCVLRYNLPVLYVQNGNRFEITTTLAGEIVRSKKGGPIIFNSKTAESSEDEFRYHFTRY